MMKPFQLTTTHQCCLDGNYTVKLFPNGWYSNGGHDCIHLLLFTVENKPGWVRYPEATAVRIRSPQGGEWIIAIAIKIKNLRGDVFILHAVRVVLRDTSLTGASVAESLQSRSSRIET
jgi:hypothetical protein